MTLNINRPGQALSVALLLLAAALVATLAWEAQSGLAMRTRLVEDLHSLASPPPLAITPPFALQPPGAYVGITQHPLFVSSRLPPLETASAAAQVVQNLELKGVAISGTHAVVLIKDLQTGKTERLLSGGSRNTSGPLLEQASPDAAVVKQGGISTKLELHVQRSGTQKIPAPQVEQPKKAEALTPAGQTPVKPVGVPGSKLPITDPSVQPLDQSQIDAMRAKLGLPPRKQLFPNLSR